MNTPHKGATLSGLQRSGRFFQGALPAGKSRIRYSEAARALVSQLPPHFLGFFLHPPAAFLDVLAHARHGITSTERKHGSNVPNVWINFLNIEAPSPRLKE